MSNGFYIGQRVVCVKSHSRGRVTVGDIYTIEGFACCKLCGRLSFDIGLPNAPNELGTRCHKCNVQRCISETRCVISASLFRPLQEQDLSSELALKEVERTGEIRREQEVEYQPA